MNASAEVGAIEHATILLMGDAGLRMGEAIALEWGHLKWGARPVIVIQRSFWRSHFGPTKGGRPRTVPMTERLAAALRAIPRTLHEPWVLTRVRTGKPAYFTQGMIRYRVARAEQAAGLRDSKDGQCHRLRHTFVTRLASAGVPARTIMELAGHRDLATSLRYMHVARGATDQAIAALQAADQGHRLQLWQGRTLGIRGWTPDVDRVGLVFVWELNPSRGAARTSTVSRTWPPTPPGSQIRSCSSLLGVGPARHRSARVGHDGGTGAPAIVWPRARRSATLRAATCVGTRRAVALRGRAPCSATILVHRSRMSSGKSR